jgi:hypothetical protein
VLEATRTAEMRVHQSSWHGGNGARCSRTRQGPPYKGHLLTRSARSNMEIMADYLYVTHGICHHRQRFARMRRSRGDSTKEVLECACRAHSGPHAIHSWKRWHYDIAPTLLCSMPPIRTVRPNSGWFQRGFQCVRGGWQFDFPLSLRQGPSHVTDRSLDREHGSLVFHQDLGTWLKRRNWQKRSVSIA